MTPPKHIVVDIAVASPLRRTFHYRWPADWSAPQVGVRVRIPLGKSVRQGVLIAIIENDSNDVDALREVADVLDDAPLFDTIHQQWVARLSRYYLTPLGMMWDTALAWAAVDDKQRFCPEDSAALAEHFPELHQAYRNKTALTLKTLRQRCPVDDLCQRVQQAVKQHCLRQVHPKSAWLAPSENMTTPPKLYPEQQAAVAAIVARRHEFHPVLLFGCTGSGKTEVYLEAAKQCVADGGQVLILVPEIGLTPMWQARLRQRFERIVIWHSALSSGQRIATRAHLDEAQVLIGTRSALFLPLPRLAMIVMDEEHDSSFKQQDGSCYSARDAALMLAQQRAIPMVMGTATPSLETWSQAQQGRYLRLDLTRQAIANQPVKQAIVDMRNHKDVLSPALLSVLQTTREAGEQSILFLNRRGYAPALQCTACGHVYHCPACSVRLTLHRHLGELHCHVCTYIRRAPRACEECGEAALLPMGAGTERLDEELKQQIPELRVERFDRDKVTSHQRLVDILQRFEQGELDCLIGTQMLVKGHDFPNVTLVGVVHADMGLSVPDFRASERWWQQMTQVMGRAGRGHKPGRVLLQTWMPEAPWLARIRDQSAADTLDEELAMRKLLHFPPFSRWVRLVCSATQAEKAELAAQQIATACQHIPDIQVMPAMPCALERQAHRYRYEVLLRDNSKQHLPWKLAPILERLRLPSQTRCRIDVDPLDMG
ncbi:MAG: primosomal protein N' [Mariprofundaceae bacterium]|nr:primosomal protein N' [Mariprofundaceae bacterium]